VPAVATHAVATHAVPHALLHMKEPYMACGACCGVGAAACLAADGVPGAVGVTCAMWHVWVWCVMLRWPAVLVHMR